MNTFLKRSALVASIALVVPAASFAASFAATGVGPIPDNLPAGGLVMSFNVAGAAAAPASVGVGITLTHTWVGDIIMTLTAPGGSPSAIIVRKIGDTTGTAFGDSSNFAGTYAFFDAHPGNIWTAAAAPGVTDLVAVPPGNYFPSAPLTGAAAPVNPVFAGLTPAQVNGTWTLTVSDNAAGDTGTITSATLFIDQTTPVSLQNFSVD